MFVGHSEFTPYPEKVTREFGYTLDTHPLDKITNPAGWPYRSDKREADPPIAVKLPTGELAYYDLTDDPDAESIFNWMHGYMWGKLC